MPASLGNHKSTGELSLVYTNEKKMLKERKKVLSAMMNWLSVAQERKLEGFLAVLEAFKYKAPHSD